MKKNAQGTIEYLVILAVIVVISLLVVSLISNNPGPTQQVNNALSGFSTQTTPITITEAVTDADGNYYVRVGNKTNSNLKVKEIRIGENENEYPGVQINPYSDNAFIINTNNICSEGEVVATEVQIVYLTDNNLEKTMIYPIPVNFDCNPYSTDTGFSDEEGNIQEEYNMEEGPENTPPTLNMSFSQEPDGTVVYDDSSHNNHGTTNEFDGDEFNDSCDSGSVEGCYVFDGINDYIEVADDNTLDLNNNFSFSVWVDANNLLGPPQGILTKGNYSLKEYDGNYIFEVLGDGSTWSKSGDVGESPAGLAVYNGKLYAAAYTSDAVYVFDGTTWEKSGDVEDGPYGLAVYDGNLFVSNNGSNDVHTFDGSTWSKSGDVGNDPAGLAVYDGKLYVANGDSDDIWEFDGTTWEQSGTTGDNPSGLAVYNGKLYAAHLVSDDIWEFDGTTWEQSGTVTDFPAGLAVYNGKLYAANDARQDHDDIWEFDGTTWEQSGTAGDSPRGLAVYNGKLYAAHVGSDDIWEFDGTTWEQSGTAGDNPRGLAVYNGKLYTSNAISDDIYEYGTGKSVWASRGSGFEHIAGIVTNNEIKLYINGEEKASASHNLSFTNNSNPLLIGKSFGSSQSGKFGGNDEVFSGSIDQAQIWDRALTADEVSQLYNSH